MTFLSFPVAVRSFTANFALFTVPRSAFNPKPADLQADATRGSDFQFQKLEAGWKLEGYKSCKKLREAVLPEMLGNYGQCHRIVRARVVACSWMALEPLELGLNALGLCH